MDASQEAGNEEPLRDAEAAEGPELAEAAVEGGGFGGSLRIVMPAAEPSVVGMFRAVGEEAEEDVFGRPSCGGVALRPAIGKPGL